LSITTSEGKKGYEEIKEEWDKIRHDWNKGYEEDDTPDASIVS